MKKFSKALLAGLIILSGTTEAQTIKEKVYRSEAGIEIGGTGLLYNVFYQQKVVSLGNHSTLNLRIGSAIMPLFLFSEGDPKWGYNANVMPTVLWFKNRHAWETGVALGFFDYTNRNEEYILNGKSTKRDFIQRYLILSPQISYRYYFSKSPLYIRGSVLLHIALREYDNYGGHSLSDQFIYPWAGISGGIRF
ncbi:MAG: hypothetical protein WC756_09195 [Taibaiella sp.]|jgi:hypothetical protein